MAGHYVGGERDQMFLLATSMRDWLEEGHLAWFVIDVVDTIDASALRRRVPHGPGRPAYDPRMMLALLVYAYAVGERSSRRIEQRCRTDAAFKVITGGATPDHATIARFRAENDAVMEDLFVAVLELCAEVGLVSVGTIAIDGTKMAANASKAAFRSDEHIRAEVVRLLDEARQADRDDDDEPPTAGAVPAELLSRERRLARLRAARDELDRQQREALDAREALVEHARQMAARGHRINGRKAKADPVHVLVRAEGNVAALEVKAAAVDAERARKAADAVRRGRRIGGRAPTKVHAQLADARAERDAAAAALERANASMRVNLTDPDARLMTTAKGWVVGFNCQAAVNDQQIVLACKVTQDAADVNQWQPMVDAALHNLARIGVASTDAVFLGDAGYFSNDNLTTDGPTRLIATTKSYKLRRALADQGPAEGDPPPDASPAEAMEHRLRTEAGAALYRRRQHTVEPVFGDGKHNRGYRHLARRGLPAAASEWHLIALVHNLGKLFRHQRPPRLA